MRSNTTKLAAFCCLPLAAVTVPLAMSSWYWTIHTETADWIWVFVSSLYQVVQLVTVLAFCFSRSRVESVFRRSRDFIGLLIVLFVLPLVCAIVEDFWQVRPDSWDLLQWRLRDDWNEGRFLSHVQASVSLLLVTLAVWIWSYCGRWQLVTRDTPTPTERTPITIQRLMLITAVVAILARVLVRLQWSPNYQDADSLVEVIPITISVMALAHWRLRRKGGRWVRLLVLALVAWIASIAGLYMYARMPLGLSTVAFELVVEVATSFCSWIVLAWIAWTVLAINGLTLVYQSKQESEKSAMHAR